MEVEISITVVLEPGDEVAADEFTAALPDEIEAFVTKKMTQDGFEGTVSAKL